MNETEKFSALTANVDMPTPIWVSVAGDSIRNCPPREAVAETNPKATVASTDARQNQGRVQDAGTRVRESCDGRDQEIFLGVIIREPERLGRAMNSHLVKLVETWQDELGFPDASDVHIYQKWSLRGRCFPPSTEWCCGLGASAVAGR